MEFGSDLISFTRIIVLKYIDIGEKWALSMRAAVQRSLRVKLITNIESDLFTVTERM